jgi:hypothetical protein
MQHLMCDDRDIYGYMEKGAATDHEYIHVMTTHFIYIFHPTHGPLYH